MINHILTIAKKEFIDTLRDRRTLLTMIVIPLLLFPAIMYAIVAVQIAISKKAQEKNLRIGIVATENAIPLIHEIEKIPNVQLIREIDPGDTTNLIKSDSLDMILWVDRDFDKDLDSLRSAIIRLYYQSTDDEQIKKRLVGPIEAYEAAWLADRLEALSLSPETIDPINLEEYDIASTQERFGKLVGGFLPYIFVIFCFIGCTYPAIDLFTGEKERGTLETILTLPVHRIRFLTGKMIVVAVSGLISALLALAGLFLSIQLIDAIPDEILTTVLTLLQWKSSLMLLAMLIPLSIFFAGLLIPFASYAKSFKEAQSLITPLNFLVIIPAAIGLTPGIELNLSTSLIPILNVALSTREIVAGTIDYGLLTLVFGSLIILAAVSVIFSVKWFDRESNILRS